MCSWFLVTFWLLDAGDGNFLVRHKSALPYHFGVVEVAHCSWDKSGILFCGNGPDTRTKE
jgi:hypothetical protein